MSVLGTLKSIARKLSPARRGQPFQPQYDAARVMRAVVFAADAGSNRLRHSNAANQRCESLEENLRIAVRHFHLRSSPRFFYDAGALVHDRTKRCSDVHGWIASAHKDVVRWTREGLPVYNRTAPPLVAGFPWGGEWYRQCDDVLFPVRPHRFGFAPRLALATADEGYACAEFAALLSDWMRCAARNPDLPFISNLVVTQRLIACACAFYFLRAPSIAPHGRDALAVSSLLLQILAEDVRFLLPRIGDSYPNNHLLIDRFAGWVIAALFPEFSDRRLDVRKSEDEWLAELERQTYEDGGSFEHSVHYHGLAAEAAAAWLLLKRANGADTSQRHMERVERMLRLQADLAGPDGHAPAIGNGTEDPLFPIDGGDGCTSGALRELYRALFERDRPPLDREHPERERAFWLLGGEMAGGGDSGGARQRSHHYEVGGFHIFFDDAEATRFVFRTGPVAGAATIAGHMHADLMSVHWVHRGTPILVDSGTWSYRFRSTHPALPAVRLRPYLCGPHAHNGVVIDDVDPLGTLHGDFRPGTASAYVTHEVVEAGTDLALVQARISAPEPYAGFVRGVVHVRGQYFLVYSRLPQDAEHRDAYFPLHFDPKVGMTAENEGVVALAREGNSEARVSFTRGALSGIDSLTAGYPWASHHYGELARAPRICFRPITEERVSAFVLSADLAAGALRLEVVHSSAGAVMLLLHGKDFRDYLIVNPGGKRIESTESGLEFEGLLLWLRIAQGKQAEMRGLRMKRLRAPGHGIDIEFDSVQSEICEMGTRAVG